MLHPASRMVFVVGAMAAFSSAHGQVCIDCGPGPCENFSPTGPCVAPSGCVGQYTCMALGPAASVGCYTPSGSVPCSACGPNGFRTCSGMGQVGACRPAVLGPEQCNGCDDNGNGQVDEGQSGLACTTATGCSGVTQCTNGVSSCVLTSSSLRGCSVCAGGTQACNVDGSFGLCQPQMAAAEVCNNCDDDKNATESGSTSRKSLRKLSVVGL